MIEAAAPASFASRARSDGAAASSPMTRSRASAPTAWSAATSACAERRLTSSVSSGLFTDVDRDDATFDRSSRSLELLPLTDQRTRGNCFERAHPAKDAERVWSDDPVRFVADVPLEQPKRAVGPRTVEPVLLAAVEAEGVQHPLELSHVVASEHGSAVIQRAIAELPPCLDELFPGVGSDEPVDPKVTLPLEPADGRLRRGAERPIAFGVVDDGAERLQPRLDVRDLPDLDRLHDRCASVRVCVDPRRDGNRRGIRVGKRPYARCGSRSRRIASLGRAPVTLATSLPALNRINEGIDITP